MTTLLSLTANERKKLFRVYHRPPQPRVRRRAHVLLLLADGWSWRNVRSAAFVSFDVIADSPSRFAADGVDGLLEVTATSHARWSEEAEAILRDAIARSPDAFGYLAVN